ncbi:MAG TPA: YcaO-like family protein [Allosphingosinicella sp.]
MARARGVTRLADVTGLDRLALPVWQAVRPAGRSLSVHQGKGASHLDAALGALCEAIECDCAETAQPDGPLCGLAALPEAERAPRLGDYAHDRELPPPELVQWCIATDLLGGRTHYLPFELIALDFTRIEAPWFARSSTGLAVAASEDGAVRTALWEVIERDAVGEWDRSSRDERLGTVLDVDTIPFAWFAEWRERFRELGVGLRVFAPASPTGLPTLVVSIGAPGEFGTCYRRFSGTAAHGDPEISLFKALAEAVQSRLTFIAGVRDDFLPSHYSAGPDTSAEAPALDGVRLRDWGEIEPGPGEWERTAEQLARLGYRQVVMKRLDRPEDGLAAVKLFVPGLGSLRRRRRRPA